MDKQPESDKIENKVKIKDAGPCKKKIIIEIPDKAIQAEADEQYKSLRKDAEVPGFRKGRAPRRLLEKRFGKEATEQIKLKLLADASDSAVKDNQINLLRDPDIDYEKIELPEDGPMKFEFEVEVRPEFDLPELDGIKVTKTTSEVADEQIATEIEQLQKYSGVWTPREDGTVEVDDQVIADVIIKVEGVEEDEKLDNETVYVRANGFVGSIPVEKLDEVLKGAKVGDKKTAKTTVSKTYFKEEYRGKKVEISIDVKDIKWLKPAELDEPLLQKFGAKTKEELEENVRDMLQSKLEQQTKTEMSEQIYKYMLDNIKFDLPTDIVADQAATVLQRQYANMLRQGLGREQIEEQMEQLRAGSEEQAQQQLRTFFIMDKVTEKLEIEVTDEEINGYIAQVAMQRGQRPEKMREEMLRDGSLSQFRLQVREDKCIIKLLETAKITEKAAKKTDKVAKKVKKVEKTAKKTAKKTTKKAEKTTKKTAKKKTKE
ncbi:trigger factor [Planctomycetota bacterium]